MSDYSISFNKHRITHGTTKPKRNRKKGDIWIDTTTNIHYIFTGHKFITLEAWINSLRIRKDFDNMIQAGRPRYLKTLP